MKKKITKETIADELLKFANAKIVDDSFKLNPNDKLMKVGIDSHNLLELIIFVEKHFGIKIPDHDLTIGNLNSINTLAHCAFENYKLADAG